jgi:hypothetical protein
MKHFLLDILMSRNRLLDLDSLSISRVFFLLILSDFPKGWNKMYLGKERLKKIDKFNFVS